MAEFATIRGLKELEANLKILREQFGVRTGGVIIRGLRAGAKLIVADAKKRVKHVPSGFAPKFTAHQRVRVARSGRVSSKKFKDLASVLRSNIIEHAIPVASVRAGGKPTVLVRVRSQGYRRVGDRLIFNRPGTVPGWWWWMEFGTSRFSARPFMRPAFESQKYAAIEKCRLVMKAEIEKLFKRHGRVSP